MVVGHIESCGLELGLIGDIVGKEELQVNLNAVLMERVHHGGKFLLGGFGGGIGVLRRKVAPLAESPVVDLLRFRLWRSEVIRHILCGVLCHRLLALLGIRSAGNFPEACRAKLIDGQQFNRRDTDLLQFVNLLRDAAEGAAVCHVGCARCRESLHMHHIDHLIRPGTDAVIAVGRQRILVLREQTAGR